MLLALAVLLSVVKFRTVIFQGNFKAEFTKREAGRACRPTLFPTAIVVFGNFLLHQFQILSSNAFAWS
jgi:hypothetical protein